MASWVDPVLHLKRCYHCHFGRNDGACLTGLGRILALCGSFQRILFVLSPCFVLPVGDVVASCTLGNIKRLKVEVSAYLVFCLLFSLPQCKVVCSDFLVLLVLYMHKFINFSDVILSVKNSFFFVSVFLWWYEVNWIHPISVSPAQTEWFGRVCQHCVFCKNPKQQPLCGSSEMESALKCSIHSKILDFASSFITSCGVSDGRAG